MHRLGATRRTRGAARGKAGRRASAVGAESAASDGNATSAERSAGTARSRVRAPPAAMPQRSLHGSVNPDVLVSQLDECVGQCSAAHHAPLRCLPFSALKRAPACDAQ